MSWDRIIGQPRVVDVLSRAVAAERVAHAYLFHGPDGSGKRAAALALAQALECERRQPGNGDACGACGACDKVLRMIHPDVHVYLALPSSYKDNPTQAQVDDVTTRLQTLATEPYAEISFRRRPDLSDPTKSSNLKPFYAVDRVREINRDLRFTPAEGRFKVALLTDADTMNASAANAFLKSLEEPTPRTVLILTASRADLLLPTIISRCQQVLAFFRCSYSGDLNELDNLIEELAKIGREPLRDVLQLMLVWVRDLVLARALGPEAPLVNVDQREAIDKFVMRVEKARLADMASLVEHAQEAVAANASITLVLMALAENLREAMRGMERPRLFTPLAEA